MSSLESPQAAPAAASQSTPTTSPNAAPNATGSAAQAHWVSDWVKADGSLNNSALERLPDHLKPLKDIWGRAKTIDDIGTMDLNSRHMNGKKALAPLPPGSPPEVLAERKTLLDSLNGVPPDIKGYALAKPDNLPADQWSQPLADNFAKWCLDNSVSPTAAKKMIELQAQGIQAQVAENEKYVQQYHAKQQETFDAQIRQENIPQEKAGALIEKGVRSLGGDPESPEIQKLLKDSATVRLWAMHHAISIGESPSVTNSSQNSGATDPAKEAADIVSNPAHPLNAAFWNKDQKFSQTAQRAAIERRNQLLQLAESRPKR